MATYPSRLVLDGVPRVKFYDGGPGCPEDILLPSVMRALMEFFEDEEFGCRTCRGTQPGCQVPCSYAYFTGMTGAGSFLSWKRGWHEDNMALVYLHADAGEVERRAFQAAGLTYERLVKEDGRDNEALFRQKIIQSIQKGRPVIAYGVVGPPEPALICGYDEDGAALVGWSFFPTFPDFNQGVVFEAGGCFRKGDWFKDTESLVLVGEREFRQPLGELYWGALEWALQVTRVPIVRPGADAPENFRERANGLAAYDAWADHLLREEDFPANDEKILRQRHDVHNGAVGAVAEARWYGALFLIQAIEILHYSMAEDLLHAAAFYTAEHDLMWKIWDLAGGNGNPEAYRIFADPAVRRQMVSIIQEARRKDAQAAEHIQMALVKHPA